MLRAIADGANTVTAILPHSSYENSSNIRTICSELTKAGLLDKWMAIKARPKTRLSAWSHGPKAAHFCLTPAGEARLAELETNSATMAQQSSA